MKILHITDIHGNEKIMKKGLSFRDVEIVAISGDLIETKDDIKKVKEWIKCFKVPVIICSGNHDIEIDNGEWLYETNAFVNKKVEINKMIIDAKGYMSEEFDYNVDILIYHTPPKNTLTSTDKNYKDFGDEFLEKLLKYDFNPKYLLCGHVHNPLSLQDRINKTTIINSCFEKYNISLLKLKS